MRWTSAPRRKGELVDARALAAVIAEDAAKGPTKEDKTAATRFITRVEQGCKKEDHLSTKIVHGPIEIDLLFNCLDDNGDDSLK